MKSKQNSGQALLLVLLTTAVVSTIALSIVSRSISDITVTTLEEESLRAFSAAEAGIEEVLVSGLGEGTSTGNIVVSGSGLASEVTYNVNVTGFPDAANEFIYPVDLSTGESATVWLVSHDTNGNLTCTSPYDCYVGNWIEVCWGAVSDVAPPPTAAEVSILYQPLNASEGLKYARTVIDPTSTISGAEAADIGTCTIEGTNFAHFKRISFASLGIDSHVQANGLQLLKVRSLLNSSPQTIAVSAAGSGATFPSQGKKIESTGNAGDSLRKIEVYELYPGAPPIFDAAIFSKSGIIK